MEENIIIAILIGIAGVIVAALKAGLHSYISLSVKTLLEKIIHKKFDGNEIEQEFNAIYERMVEIKTKLNADRVTIDRFHNGSTFLPNQPAWRISRVYEICSSGVSYEANTIQNIVSMLIWDVVSAIFDTKIKKYCEKLRGLACGESGCKNPFGVYKYSINKMPESYGKMMMRNQGVVTLIQVPIIHREQIIGFVGIHFLDEYNEEIDPCFICQKVQEIAYFLNKEG